ncbi:MAG: S8 family serine peptidase [Candidatus Bathyarchaeia archaeon]
MTTITCILLLAIVTFPSGLHDKYNSDSNADIYRNSGLIDNNLIKIIENGIRSTEDLRNYSDYVCIKNDSIELVVGINNGYDSIKDELNALVQRFNGEIINYVNVNNLLAIVVNVPLQYSSSLIKELQNISVIKYIEPNAKYGAYFVPNDPYWSLQWALQKINAEYAWNTTVGTHNIRVAVIDTGVDWRHPDLIGNYIPLGYDWVNNDADPMDDNGHGTHCAGIIAATLNNGIGIAGIAQVEIIAEKALDRYGSGAEDDLAQAIIHAVQQNASIISMSWGGNFNSSLLYEAIKFAYESGVLLVASAGNARSDAKSYPAAYDEVIAVSATDQYDKPAFFTNFGEWIELAAPGVQIYSTVPGNDYNYKSGTSMSCPHVSGVAALVWSQFPNITRDQVRFHLRYTADDLGNVGFDEYYGYGRINAMKAVNQPLPEHDLLLARLEYPHYVNLHENGTFTAYILNYGTSEESGVTVELISNGTYICSQVVDFIESGATIPVVLTWMPTNEGLYNITVRVVPFNGENVTENNFVKVNVFGGTPIKACVIRSSGTYWTWITTTWEKLNKYWPKYGEKCIFIDAISLNKENISYEDLVACNADVLIISSAYSQELGWEFSDSEIEAITNYVYEGHGLIITADTFYFSVPNNNKLARLLGIDETTTWTINSTSHLNLLNPEHPIFRGIPNPYNFSQSKLTVAPQGNWVEEVLVGGEYVALGPYNESAIVTYRGVIYSSFAAESYSNDVDLQLIYNFISWSRYERPQHDLIVGLSAPPFALPGSNIWLNATVSNIGLDAEYDVELAIYINGNVAKNETISEIASDETYSTSYLWMSVPRANYNVTAYARPKDNENNTLNNKMTRIVTVWDPLIQPEEGQWANYTLCTFTEETSITELINFTYNYYISPYQINVTYWHSSTDYILVTSSIINTINRFVEKGTWAGFWFPGWIETNVTLGSQVRVLNNVGTVTGTKSVTVNNRSIECWKLSVESRYQNYTFYYEKISGLLIGYDRVTIGFLENLTLLETNIPIGALIKPKVGDYAQYSIAHFNNSIAEVEGNLKATYISIINYNKVLIQLSCLSWDKDGNIVENFTVYLVVDIRTRLVVDGPTNFNNTYYFGWIETFLDLGSSVRIWNQTGTVIGSSEYTLGQRNFNTWLVFFINETELCFYYYDKVSGLLISSVESDLDTQGHNITRVLHLLQTNVDTSPPQVVIEKPSNNTFISSSEVEVHWRGFDFESGIAYYRICLNSTEKAIVGGSFSSYNLTGLNDATYTIDVEAYDFAGNMNSSSVTIVIDKTLPTAHIITPYNGSYLKGIIEIDINGDDRWFNCMHLFINNASKAAFFSGGNHTYIWDTRVYNDGVYEVLLVVIDKANNTNADRITVIVDNTVPQVQILQQAKYVRGNSNVTIYVHDLNLRNASLSCNDTLIDCWADFGFHIVSWDTSNGTYADGNYILKAEVFDRAGNYAEFSLLVTVDNTPPTAEIVLPANGSYVSGIIHVNFSFADANLQCAVLTIDGEVIADVTSQTYYELDARQISDGEHILVLKVTDEAGNFKASKLTLTVDNTKPIAKISFPKNNSIIAGETIIMFLASDANIKNATLNINNMLWDVTNITSLAVNSCLLQDGHYEVKLEVFDMAENRECARINIVIDNTSPSVIINSPADNEELLGVACINFTIGDDHLEKALLYIDNMVFDVTGETFFYWNTTNVGDGRHTIKIVGVDAAGNVGERQIDVWTKNVQKATEESYNSGKILGILIGSLTALVLISIAIIVTRALHIYFKGKRSKDAT